MRSIALALLTVLGAATPAPSDARGPSMSAAEPEPLPAPVRTAEPAPGTVEPAPGSVEPTDTVEPAPAPDAAAEPPEVDVVVSAPRVPTPLARTPAAISVVDVSRELSARAGAGLDDALAYVPGVVARGSSNFAQDLRLSVRGFGSRATFGIRGIALLVDGFPETLPDGQAQVDSIDVESLERIEVVRGLASSLYGNAAGGVVRMETARPTADLRAFLRAVAGPHRFGKVSARATGSASTLGYAITASTLRTDGWRDLARAEQRIANAIVTAPISGGELLLALALADAPVAGDPGGLTREEARDDPRQASPLSVRFGTGESLRHGRLGASWRGAVARRQSLEVLAWGAQRSFRSDIPFTVVEFDRQAGGAGARWAWRHAVRSADARLVVGAEVQSQLDRRTNRPSEDGVAGSTLSLAQDETVSAGGLHLQEEITVAETVTIAGGVRLDVSRYRARDRLLVDGDASGSRTFRQPTGRIGAIWAPAPALSIHASVSQAYEAPTTTELVNLARGGFDPDLEPQRALGAELGARGRAAGSWWDVALFTTRIEDGLVRQEDEEARAFYVNAARSTHRGAEASAGTRLPLDLEVQATYTLIDARFDRYVPRGDDLAGRRVPGIPRHTGAVQLAWRPGAPFAAIETRTAGGWHADDENTTFEGLAWIVNARAAWPLTVGTATLTPFLAAENLGSTRSSEALRINAAGGRYFEPAPPLRVRGGVSLALGAR